MGDRDVVVLHGGFGPCEEYPKLKLETQMLTKRKSKSKSNSIERAEKAVHF